MNAFAASLVAAVDQLADDAECEFWKCPAEGEHNENCLTDCDADGNRAIPGVRR